MLLHQRYMYHISQKEMGEYTNGTYSYQQSDALGRYVSDDCIRMVLLQIIANWRIFTKAGEAGWKSIIPIYGDYISYKIAWQPAYFWLTLILGIISSYLQGTLEISESLTVYMLVILIKIILVVISIMYSIKLARAFGRGTGFAIGLSSYRQSSC